ncbi:MAG: HAMP domain-containing sensor histidine kinase, partial [Myxococcota bacterium]
GDHGPWRILLFLPAGERARERDGFVMAVLDVDLSLAAALTRFHEMGIALELSDEMAPVAGGLYRGRLRPAPAGADSVAPDGPLLVTSFRFAGRQWHATIAATKAYVARNLSWQPWLVLSTGVLFVAVMAVFLLLLTARAAQLASSNARLTEALRGRDEFLSLASHELKTPITPISLQLQALARLLARCAVEPSLSPSLTVTARQAIDVADRQLRRLATLINDMLDATRIGAGRFTMQPETCDLADLVRRMEERHRPVSVATQTPLQVEAPASLVGRFDPLRMEQVVANLLSNAFKYAPGNPVQITLSAENGRARLVVKDGGPGISDADVRRIFEPYERAVAMRHQPGLGLGLHITRHIVEAHGGTITVHSRAGEGATFVVEVPLGIQPGESTTLDTPRASPFPRGMEPLPPLA